jgi:cell division protein FtsZ
MQKAVDTLIIIPNQNLFRVANERTTFADAFAMADQVLCSGVACITDLIVKEGLVNLDFADVCAIMSEMGTAMIGTGEATGERRALRAAEAAIANPLLDDTSMRGARGLLISITGGDNLTLYEVDEAASRIRQEVEDEANIIMGATFESALGEAVRVSVVATGIDQAAKPASGQSQAGRPHAADADGETGLVPAPVIPFPEPNERRRAAVEEAHRVPPAVRRRSLLERLGVPARASGWS